MEDVLAVYTRPRDADYPLVCLDESSKQLIGETRVPIPMKPGRPARCDYEYERNGTANLFMMFAPLEGWRHVEVTDRHTAVEYAHVLKDLADLHFANAKTIVLVQDNLNIHCKASLYEAFPAAEARRLVERFGRVSRRDCTSGFSQNSAWNSRFTLLPSGKHAGNTELPMYEQSAPFDRNDLNQSASLYLRAPVALVLSHDPHDQCGVDVMPYRSQS